MVLKLTGAISLAEIAAEFQIPLPALISKLYGLAPGLPASGAAIAFADFYGKALAVAGGIPLPLSLTSGTATGSVGPTLADLQSSYGSPAWSTDATLFKQYQTFLGYQDLELSAGTYAFTLSGASGGASATNRAGGKGAKLTATFAFPTDTSIVVVCGQAGLTTSQSLYAGGGGGCTCVVALDGDGVTPLMLAGGGGAGGQTVANATIDGGRLLDYPPTASVAGNSTYRPAGSPTYYHANGAGYAMSTVVPTGSTNTPSLSFAAGFTGSVSPAVTAVGGFGGGGAGSTGSVGAGGGGGGWRGGDAGLRYTDGSGGTSYLNTTDSRYEANSATHTPGFRAGNGLVSIVRVA